jgi:glycolate oxidase FAD binding subunit
MSSKNGDKILETLQATGNVAGDDGAAGHRVDGVTPRHVVYPADVQDLAQVLAVAAEWDLAVAPWGGGTRIALGNCPERLDLVIDLSDLNRIVEHNPADLTATAQAGTTLSALQTAFAAHGQFLALDPPLPSRATLGGTLATAVSGPLKWQYGSPRDAVIGMTVAQADGRLTKSGGKVVKNVSGYDMSKMHIGGLGTLGVIAEVSLKLIPLPAQEATLVAAFDSIEHCFGAALDVFRSDVAALAITTFDHRADQLMGASGSDDDHLLAIRLGGRPLTFDRVLRETRSICAGHNPARIEIVDEPESSRLWRSLADFGWDRATTPIIGVRAGVLPLRTPELAAALSSPGRTEGLQPAIVSHPAHGTVLAGWSYGDETPSDGTGSEVLRHATTAVQGLDGAMVVERAPESVKSGIDVWGDVGGQEVVFRGLKEQFDPKRLLNPGRFAGGI